jgi:hypothetical protein
MGIECGFNKNWQADGGYYGIRGMDGQLKAMERCSIEVVDKWWLATVPKSRKSKVFYTRLMYRNYYVKLRYNNSDKC